MMPDIKSKVFGAALYGCPIYTASVFTLVKCSIWSLREVINLEKPFIYPIQRSCQAMQLSPQWLFPFFGNELKNRFLSAHIPIY